MQPYRFFPVSKVLNELIDRSERGFAVFFSWKMSRQSTITGRRVRVKTPSLPFMEKSVSSSNTLPGLLIDSNAAIVVKAAVFNKRLVVLSFCGQ